MSIGAATKGADMTATVQPTYTLHDATPNGELIAPRIAEAPTAHGIDAVADIYAAVGIRVYPVRWSSRLELNLEASQ